MKVTNTEFVEKWAEAFKSKHSQRWVGEQLGINDARVSAKASYLRSKGVNLPKLTVTRSKLDVEELNAIISNATQEGL